MCSDCQVRHSERGLQECKRRRQKRGQRRRRRPRASSNKSKLDASREGRKGHAWHVNCIRAGSLCSCGAVKVESALSLYDKCDRAV